MGGPGRPKGTIFPLPLLVLAAGFLAVYAAVVARLVRNWATDSNYSHGFLIIPVAVYLAWRSRGRLAAAPSKPSVAGLAVVLASLCAAVAGVAGAEVFVVRLSMIGALAGA